MAYLYQVAVLVLVIAQMVGGKPTKLDYVISETTGYLSTKGDSGTFTRLKRQDVDGIKEDERHDLRLDMEDGSDPFNMHIQESSVWTKDSILVVRQGDHAFTAPQTTLDKGCYLSGKLTSHDGAVSIKRCGEKMTGRVQIPGYHFEIEELPISEKDDHTHARFRVIKRKVEEEIIGNEERAQLQELESEGIFTPVDNNTMEVNKSNNREKRGIRKITIELAIFVDSGYVDHLIDDVGLYEYDEIKDWFVTKWSTVQGVYIDPEEIGAEVTIQVKKVEVWWKNPTSYPHHSISIQRRLRWFCYDNRDADKFDQKVLYTAHTRGHALGLSYVGTTCYLRRKCFVVRSPTPNVRVELHEMGHNLGFPHDPGFGDCDPSDGHGDRSGFMGWVNTYRYLPCYKKKLKELIKRPSMGCLYEQNVSEYQQLSLSVTPNNSVSDVSTTKPPFTTDYIPFEIDDLGKVVV